MKKLRKKSASDYKPITRLELHKELENFSTKEDLRELGNSLEKKFERKFDEKLEENRKLIVGDIKALVEIRDQELQGAHEDELASAEGRKDAPLQWKSMPRRLKTVETEVERIKDHLEIS